MADSLAVKLHHEFLEKPTFDKACDLALLEYQRILSTTDTGNFNGAAAAHFRMLGAQEFIQVFRNLGDAPNRPEPAPAQSLNFKA